MTTKLSHEEVKYVFTPKSRVYIETKIQKVWFSNNKPKERGLRIYDHTLYSDKINLKVCDLFNINHHTYFDEVFLKTTVCRHIITHHAGVITWVKVAIVPTTCLCFFFPILTNRGVTAHFHLCSHLSNPWVVLIT